MACWSVKHVMWNFTEVKGVGKSCKVWWMVSVKRKSLVQWEALSWSKSFHAETQDGFILNLVSTLSRSAGIPRIGQKYLSENTSYNCLLFRDIFWCCSLISVVYCMILEYCVCGCLCVYLHMLDVWVCVSGGSTHSWLDARRSKYTPPSCSLLSPPACCSGFSWDSNLQQRLSSPHTRQG